MRVAQAAFGHGRPVPSRNDATCGKTCALVRFERVRAGMRWRGPGQRSGPGRRDSRAPGPFCMAY